MKNINKKYIVIVTIFVVVGIFACVLLAITNYHHRMVYETKVINMIANVETDGTIRVADQRVVEFGGSAQNIQIPISKTTDKSFIQVSSVRIVDTSNLDENGDARVYTLSRNTLNAEESEKIHFNPQHKVTDDMTYFFDRESSSVYISVGESLEANKMYTLSLSYNIQDSVYVYDDMAEVYWDWIPNWTNSVVDDAILTLQVPTTTNVSPDVGENIWAWDHGRSGYIDYAGEGAFKVVTANIKSGQGSRFHVLFTKYWMSNITRSSEMIESGARRDLAISEEAKWGDGDNAKIKNAYILNLVLAILAAVILFYVVFSYWYSISKFKRLTSGSIFKATFDEQVIFDSSIYKRQIIYLIMCAICLISALIGTTILRAYIGSFVLVVVFLVCIALSSACPSIHTSFRDKI